MYSPLRQHDDDNKYINNQFNVDFTEVDVNISLGLAEEDSLPLLIHSFDNKIKEKVISFFCCNLMF